MGASILWSADTHVFFSGLEQGMPLEEASGLAREWNAEPTQFLSWKHITAQHRKQEIIFTQRSASNAK